MLYFVTTQWKPHCPTVKAVQELCKQCMAVVTGLSLETDRIPCTAGLQSWAHCRTAPSKAGLRAGRVSFARHNIVPNRRGFAVVNYHPPYRDSMPIRQELHGPGQQDSFLQFRLHFLSFSFNSAFITNLALLTVYCGTV